MMPPWSPPLSLVDGMTRPAMQTGEALPVGVQARPESPDEPGTRSSERSVWAAGMTDGLAHPDRPAPAAYLDRPGGPAAAGLDAVVLQRWRRRHLFYPLGDARARRSAPRLTDVGSALDGPQGPGRALAGLPRHRHVVAERPHGLHPLPSRGPARPRSRRAPVRTPPLRAARAACRPCVGGLNRAVTGRRQGRARDRSHTSASGWYSTPSVQAPRPQRAAPAARTGSRANRPCVDGHHPHPPADRLKARNFPRLRATQSLNRGFTPTPANIPLSQPCPVHAGPHFMPPNER
jgi:hypothetical protein